MGNKKHRKSRGHYVYSVCTCDKDKRTRPSLSCTSPFLLLQWPLCLTEQQKGLTNTNMSALTTAGLPLLISWLTS